MRILIFFVKVKYVFIKVKIKVADDVFVKLKVTLIHNALVKVKIELFYNTFVKVYVKLANTVIVEVSVKLVCNNKCAKVKVTMLRVLLKELAVKHYVALKISVVKNYGPPCSFDLSLLGQSVRVIWLVRRMLGRTKSNVGSLTFR